ncbi:MAG: MarR family transcriptional regulator [Mycobacterium sp.]|nr:MarR family transcriptional regulator [Mycobacterium sp.]
MSELPVLQAIRLKGRISLADLAATLNQDTEMVAGTVEQLTASGLLVDGTALRITQSGRARLETLLAAERKGIDVAAMSAVYNAFRSVNAEFKSLTTDWQLKGGPEGIPNTHDDAGYDAAVLARLDDVHARAVPIIEAAAAQLPRLAVYLPKLVAALDKIRSGETAWLTRPLIDSYHTVWFELHEELILATGSSRGEAAQSGDGQ